jgi:hypothetical protein
VRQELGVPVSEGEGVPLRAGPVLPHQCRCIIFDAAGENRCQMAVFDGPDAPVCRSCEDTHWGPNWEQRGAQLLGHRMAPVGGPMLQKYSGTSEDG